MTTRQATVRLVHLFAREQAIRPTTRRASLAACCVVCSLDSSCAQRRWLSAPSRSSQSADSLQSNSSTPTQAKLQLDFFGEPVTFIGQSVDDKTTNAIAAMDGFLLAVVSKGKSCTGGGEEEGIDVQPMHAAAVSWSEALRHAGVWNTGTDNHAAPMLAVVAVAPLLAQAGAAYVRHLDELLKQARSGAPGLPPIQMYDMAKAAVACKADERLNHRERLHLEVLDYLLRDEHPTALAAVLRILRMCPGDAFALSLAMDLAQTVGDAESALRAAGSVASYWNERKGGIITPAIPGHAMASAYIALGLAVGSRIEEAEQMAARAMKQARKVSGGIASWAQAHVFDAGGRVAEGISALANNDGVANYEGSGLLFFDCRLSGYGARFSLDREERGRGRSKAFRLYQAHFDRVLEYSGFAAGRPWQQPHQRAPIAWVDRKAIEIGEYEDEQGSSLMGSLFGGVKEHAKDTDGYEVILKGESAPSTRVDGWEPSCEDVLTWIPPTPQLLTEATMLLLRLTLNGIVSRRDPRWLHIRNAWQVLLSMQTKYDSSLMFSPLASMAASLVHPPSDTGGDMIGSGRLADGLHAMGRKLELGGQGQEPEQQTTALREALAEREPDFWLPVADNDRSEWKAIFDDLASAIDGFGDVSNGQHDVNPTLRFSAWTFDARPLLEHSVVFAACKSGDTESLCYARSICSQGVTLRPNSPDEWWRYSIVLGLLGDEIASEDALNNSINVGSGQGARSG